VDVAKKLDEATMEKINGILGNQPYPYQGYGGAGRRQIRNKL